MIDRKRAGLVRNINHTMMIGIVVSITDPHNRGRIKVTLPKYSNTTEYWVYPVSPLFGGGDGTEATPSSNSWGWYAVPRIGDTVIVAAIDGDLSTLILLGGLNNRHQNLPDATSTGENVQFRTYNGHTLTFKTASSDESVNITTAGGIQVDLNDATDTVTIQKASTSIVIAADGSVSINTNANIGLTASGNINATATGNVNITGATVNLL